MADRAAGAPQQDPRVREIHAMLSACDECHEHHVCLRCYGLLLVLDRLRAAPAEEPHPWEALRRIAHMRGIPCHGDPECGCPPCIAAAALASLQ